MNDCKYGVQIEISSFFAEYEREREKFDHHHHHHDILMTSTNINMIIIKMEIQKNPYKRSSLIVAIVASFFFFLPKMKQDSIQIKFEEKKHDSSR